MKLTLETKTNKPLAEPVIAGGKVLITPPIDEDWWLFRVKLSDTQAIVGSPKFGVIGVGFAQEEDWNTNLPSSCGTAEIYEHIKHNKGDDNITDAQCLQAIAMIQAAVKSATA